MVGVPLVTMCVEQLYLGWRRCGEQIPQNVVITGCPQSVEDPFFFVATRGFGADTGGMTVEGGMGGLVMVVDEISKNFPAS